VNLANNGKQRRAVNSFQANGLRCFSSTETNVKDESGIKLKYIFIETKV